MRTALCLLLAQLLLTMPAFAQHAHGHGADDGHDRVSRADAPYAGLHERAIKALSPEQVADLRAGRGMALALAAELNGFPGPAHTLELADALRLSPEQLERTRTQFSEMQSAARSLGEQLIEAERALDGLFANGAATPENVRRKSAEAARLLGELRATHLSYHLTMLEILSAEQIDEYNRLRGYR